MNLWNKKVLKESNRTLNQATNVKAKQDTSFVSLAFLKLEGGIRVLYPIPTRANNTFDYTNNERKMQKRVPAPVKITNFLYAKQAKTNIPNSLGNGVLVAVAYFDFDISPVYKQYLNTSDPVEKTNPKSYKSDNATYNTDRSCLIIDIIQ